MSEAIEQRGGHLGVTEDAWPFTEGELGGDEDRGAMKAPAARSCTSVWLIGVPSNLNSARSLASGSLAMVSWYLIDRACFSPISALSRSPMMRWGSCWRLTAVAMISSKAAFMP